LYTADVSDDLSSGRGDGMNGSEHLQSVNKLPLVCLRSDVFAR
jgi:hypothetical protein